jgi:hypothetical protein
MKGLNPMIVVIDEICCKEPLLDVLTLSGHGRKATKDPRKSFERIRRGEFRIDAAIDSPGGLYGPGESIWFCHDEGHKPREVIIARARIITMQMPASSDFYRLGMGLLLDVVSPEIAEAVRSLQLPSSNGNTLEGFLEAVGCL